PLNIPSLQTQLGRREVSRRRFWTITPSLTVGLLPRSRCALNADETSALPAQRSPGGAHRLHRVTMAKLKSLREITSMAKRTASAVWEGTLKEGKGRVKLGSGAFEGKYSFASRFEEGTGTNPEELIGAAHAGCFSMALAAGLTRAGLNPKRISTTANVSLEKV